MKNININTLDFLKEKSDKYMYIDNELSEFFLDIYLKLTHTLLNQEVDIYYNSWTRQKKDNIVYKKKKVYQLNKEEDKDLSYYNDCPEYQNFIL